ncbi:MAG: thioredoxin fold domain-containing protein [Opitutaceae bacterium]|nr:thioredoxin fold domain-containing protein [Opitutaceae bacterium]
MNRLLLALLFLIPGLDLRAGKSAWLPIENQVSEISHSQDVTVVHFWAPWCSNCAAELADGAWSSFVASNPKVHFVFVTIWNTEDGRDLLARHGLGKQANFQLLLHPNGSRRQEDMMRTFMGFPVTWTPTTWVFRDGKLRYALNYGEIRFPMLQQMLDDTARSW